MTQRVNLSKPCLIEHPKLKIVISDGPTNTNIDEYISEFRRFGVTDIVRTCEKTYEASDFEEVGMKVHEFFFKDIHVPSDDIILQWLHLVSTVEKKGGLIAIHCMAGLGRSPTMVALALMSKGETAVDAIAYLRSVRSGCISSFHERFLKQHKKVAGETGCQCVIQ